MHIRNQSFFTQFIVIFVTIDHNCSYTVYFSSLLLIDSHHTRPLTGHSKHSHLKTPHHTTHYSFVFLKNVPQNYTQKFKISHPP